MKKFVRVSINGLGVVMLCIATFSGAWLWKTGDFSLFSEGRRRFTMEPARVEALLREKAKSIPESQVSDLAEHLVTLCEQHGLTPALILSLIQAESAFRVNVVSHRGAVGLMQIMPGTARYIADRLSIQYAGPKMLSDPFVNLQLGVGYLAYLRDRYESNLDKMLAAYNMGPARVDELISMNRFRVRKTRPYIESIRRSLYELREWGRGPAVEGQSLLRAMGGSSDV